MSIFIKRTNTNYGTYITVIQLIGDVNLDMFHVQIFQYVITYKIEYIYIFIFFRYLNYDKILIIFCQKNIVRK